MNKKELAQAVIEAQSACPEFKQAAQNYLDSKGTENEAAAGKALVAEAEEDISPIEGTIEFFKTDMAKQIFGEEGAKEKHEHAKQIKAEGAIYCDCPGCTAAKNIIDNEELFVRGEAE